MKYLGVFAVIFVLATVSVSARTVSEIRTSVLSAAMTRAGVLGDNDVTECANDEACAPNKAWKKCCQTDPTDKKKGKCKALGYKPCTAPEPTSDSGVLATSKVPEAPKQTPQQEVQPEPKQSDSSVPTQVAPVKTPLPALAQGSVRLFRKDTRTLEEMKTRFGGFCARQPTPLSVLKAFLKKYSKTRWWKTNYMRVQILGEAFGGNYATVVAWGDNAEDSGGGNSNGIIYVADIPAAHDLGNGVRGDANTIDGSNTLIAKNPNEQSVVTSSGNQKASEWDTFTCIPLSNIKGKLTENGFEAIDWSKVTGTEAALPSQAQDVSDPAAEADKLKQHPKTYQYKP